MIRSLPVLPPSDTAPEGRMQFNLPMGVRVAEYERLGYRPLVGDEADKLKYLEPVTVLDTQTAELSTGKVVAGNGEVIKIMFRSGAIFAFDVDNPDFWPADENRDRKPPTVIEDGREFVIVSREPYPSNPVARTPSLFNALKASKEFARLTKELAEVSGKHDALWADYLALQERVAALESICALRVA